MSGEEYFDNRNRNMAKKAAINKYDNGINANTCVELGLSPSTIHEKESITVEARLTWRRTRTT
jgi:hypothetical protein